MKAVGGVSMITPRSRPRVILNAAMSLDGKIATSTGESRLSSREDLRRVHRLRASVDGIMVGLRTILVDDPKLIVRSHRTPKLPRIIVDSKARTPLEAYVVKTASEIPTIIAVTSQATDRRVIALRSAGVTLLRCGPGPRVSLPILLRRLKQIGIRTVLLEGGGQLNWSMLSQGLVDEITVAISPVILGGAEAVTLVEGEGSESIGKAVGLRLLSSKKFGRDLVLHFKVLR